MEALSISNELLPFGSPFIALFCLVPFYTAFYSAKTYRRASLLMGLQILTVHLCSSYWLANFHGFAAFTLGASAFGTALQGALCAVVLHAFPRKVSESRRLQEKAGLKRFDSFIRMMWFSAGWIFWEFVKSTGAIAYPWGTLSMGAYNWKILTQIADVTGVWGVSFICALFSALLGESFLEVRKEDMRQNFKFVTAVFALCAAYGIIQFTIPREPVKKFNIVLTQQNVDPWEAGDEESIRISKELTDKGIGQLKEEGLRPDLVVWSEGVLSKKFPNARHYYETYPDEESLKAFIEKKGAPFIIGGMAIDSKKPRKILNTALLFDVKGNYSGFYSKIQLVPFAEKIPYAENPLMNKFMKEVVGFTSSLKSGYQYVLFKVPLSGFDGSSAPLSYKAPLYANIELNKSGVSNSKSTAAYTANENENPDSYVRFSTPICFEDAFPAVCSKLFNMGSEVFVNITNDSWSKTNSSELQHFIVSSYRAIECRTTLVRCANAGYTVVVGPNGKILNELKLFETDSLGIQVPVYEHKETIYTKYGDWFAYACCILILAFAAICGIMENFSFAAKFRIRIERTRIDSDNEISLDDDAISTESTADAHIFKAKEIEITPQPYVPASKNVFRSISFVDSNNEPDDNFDVIFKDITIAEETPEPAKKAQGKTASRKTVASDSTKSASKPKAAKKASETASDGKSPSAKSKTTAKKTVAEQKTSDSIKPAGKPGRKTTPKASVTAEKAVEKPKGSAKAKATTESKAEEKKPKSPSKRQSENKAPGNENTEQVKRKPGRPRKSDTEKGTKK